MKRSLWVLSAALLLSSFSYAQANKNADKKAAGSSSVEQTLMELERKWVAAGLKNDAAALGDILAERWSAISSEGKMETRAQALDNAKKAKFTRSEVSEMKVQIINPETAVVTGVWVGVGTNAQGQKIDTSERWTDVFVNLSGKWKAVASQSTTIKK
jgi:ketosteroid isomerase-like protein